MSERLETLLDIVSSNADFSSAVKAFIMEDHRNSLVFPKAQRKDLEEKAGITKLEFLMVSPWYVLSYNSTATRITNGINSRFEKTHVLLSQYIDTFESNVNAISNSFQSECYAYLLTLSHLVEEVQVVKKLMFQKNYSIKKDDSKKPWDTDYPEYDDAIRKKKLKEVLDDSQNYINSLIDDVERYCTETLSSIKQHYETELKAALVPVTKKIAERRECLKSNLDRYSATSEDTLSLEKEITRLEAKNQFIAELSAEIDRIEEGVK
jgi:hypothetical protein